MADVKTIEAAPAEPARTTVPEAPGNDSVPAGGARQKTGGLLRSLFWGIGCVLAVIGLAWATGHLGPDHRAALPPEDPEQAGESPALMVTVEPVATRSLKRTVEAVGTLYGFEEIVVSAKSEGPVIRIHHDVSDRISPDELLLELDPTDPRLAVEQAESNLRVELSRLGLDQAVGTDIDLSQVPTVVIAREKRELARLKMDRIQHLAERQATTQEGVDNAVSEFRMASAEYENQVLMAKAGLATIHARQAALSIAQQQLSDTRVRAPIPQRTAPDGMSASPYVMVGRSISEGTFVRVGDELCRLVIDGTLKLRVAVPERHAAEIEVGQTVDVYTAASSQPCAGVVTVINPAVEVSTRTFQVEIQVVNDKPGLKPGSFAKAVIAVSEDPHAQTVPLAAMVRYAGVIKLFLFENGTAREVQFTPGVQNSEWVEVARPELPENSQVITSGQYALAEGTAVRIRPQRKPEDSPATAQTAP